MKPVPLYFIAGFLGAGKTSVLNSLLKSLDGRRAGLIINEFGAVGVDASRIRDASGEIFELNKGQIFCACLAAPLAASLIQLAEKGPDLILAECSGLSKPTTLRDMVDGIRKTSTGRIEMAGLITVVDGPRYPVLSQSVQAVREQVAYAAAVVLNKTDLMSPLEVSSVKSLLRELRPGVPLISAAHGQIGMADVENVLSEQSGVIEPDIAYSGWGQAGRPKSYSLYPFEPVSLTLLKEFLRRAAPDTFRIKGALPAQEGGHFVVDWVGEHGVCIHNTGDPKVTGLVIIVPGDGRDLSSFAALWKDTVHTKVQFR